MRVLLGIGLASFCCLAAAADTSHVAAARRLVDLIGIEQMYGDVDAACRANISRPLDAREAYAANPEAFGGVSPRSAYWVEVERLFQAYGQDACGVSDIDAIKDIYVQVFSNRLSIAELETVTAAQLTPEGRKTKLAMLEAARLMIRHQLAQQQKNVEKAHERYEQGVQAVAAKYKAVPR